jgi:hypothetical protein
MASKYYKSFTIADHELRHMLMEDSLHVWMKDQYEKQKTPANTPCVMHYDSGKKLWTFIPVKLSLFDKIKVSVLNWLEVKYVVRPKPGL